MKNSEILKDLELSLTNGECLEVMKKERGYTQAHIKKMKENIETPFYDMKQKIQLLQSYDVLIESFEKYLNHEIAIMKNGIPAEKYYFLLEWKDNNMDKFLTQYDNRRLCDLGTYELNELYKIIKDEE